MTPRNRLFGFLAFVALLLAIAVNTKGLAASDGTAVSAINYTGKELNAFLFEEPDDSRKVAGGAGLDPYAGGGTMCCFPLPRRWHKGIRVKLRYDWWNGSSDHRDFQYLTVELPPYPTGEPGMLWAIFHEDGSVEVFASAVDPGHPKWPGKIKHWPIPSREYKLKLWQEEYNQLKTSLESYENFVNSPTLKNFQEAWRFGQDYEPKRIEGFSGPTDAGFQASEIEHFKKSIKETRKTMDLMEEQKP